MFFTFCTYQVGVMFELGQALWKDDNNISMFSS